ncbi:NAD(P)-binding protein [Annulohypoxylon truncatum]|uniref:NAD(P)-binding protein n=1 Tax=Annulohypoxylon truncatum TaxID=327061 RepID=UPI0020075E6E|nr:NAD(P)-binding protein [Annulohypoxylon truncatum]KAI1212767.1 NAD(P)-binding protein [Annulohypoxylon truncatum]
MATLRPLRAQGMACSVARSSIRPIQRTASLKAWPTPRVQVRCKSGPYGYTQAKSLVFSEYGEPKDVLKLHTHSISPSLTPSSVLLRTLAAPINPADVNTIQGTYGAKPAFDTLLGTAQPSVVPGNEGAFEVVSSSSADLSSGDWVIPKKTQFGTWRTHALAPADAVIKVDRTGLTPEQVATVSVNPCSAYRMLRDYAHPYPLREGDWFIQNGANSGVGRAAIQLGKLWGYRSINVVRARETAAEDEALKKELLDLGATHVVTEPEFTAREFRDRLAEWTRGNREGVRLGLNCVGGKSAQGIAYSLGRGGTVVTYGGMSRAPVALPTGLLIFKDIRFVGFWLSRWADGDAAAKERTVAEILGLVREGKFRDVPIVKVPWTWETEVQELKDAVQGTFEGFRKGKGIFTFKDT